MLRDSFVKPLSTIHVTVAHTLIASSKPKVELDHNRPVNVYSYDPKDGHRSAKTVDAIVDY